MIIGLVTPEFSPASGGIASYCMNLARHLCEENSVIVIAPGNPETHRNNLSRIFSRSFPTVDFIPTSSWNSNIPSVRSIEHQLGLGHSISRLHREYNLDVLHFASPHAFGPGFPVEIRTPIVTTVHSLIRSDVNALRRPTVHTRNWRGTDFAKIAAFPALWANERRMLHKSRNLIAVSSSVRQELGSIFAEKTETIPNGVPTDLFYPGQARPEQEVNVLIASRLMPSKGIEVALAACARLQQRDQAPPLKFQFAGQGNLKRYQEARDRLGIDPETCIFLGAIPYEKMPYLYRSATVFCCPSLHEGMPMTILEAMASGLPIVSTSVGSIQQVVEDKTTGIIVQPGNVEDLADAILWMARNRETARLFGMRGFTKATSLYSSKAMAERTISVYTMAGK